MGKQGRPLGGNKAQNIKLSTASAVKIDPDMKLKKIEREPEGTKYKCTCCGKVYSTQNGNFPVTNSFLYAGNNGHLTICRHCVEKYYGQLVDFYSGNEEHALERCCSLFDWYYNTDVIAMTKNSNQGRSKISLYPSKMNMLQIKEKGTTYLDTLKERSNNRIMDLDDSIEVDNSSVEVPKDRILFFGFGYSPEEYEFLNNQYADWTTRYECKTKAQEELFKNLCLSQITIQRAQRSGSTKEFVDATKTFQDLLGTANLKPNQTNDNAIADQNTFGTLIKKWENEEPIAEPNEEWKDVDGIKELIDVFFYGHLCHAVDIHNDLEDQYVETMKKYTVSPPQYNGDEDSGDTSLLDKFSNKGDKK